ncbi:MAG: glycosyltransferase [Chloroflexi bacterium]|nr:glycosyltransferase [Chloroflexota bacterium]
MTATAGSAADAGATPELSIVLPVYNEGEAVEPVLRALHAAVSAPTELLVVWDFDGDTTRPVVERLAAELPGLRGVRNDLGRGVLNAMRAGIAEARGSLVLISMADGSDEPAIVDAMVGRDFLESVTIESRAGFELALELTVKATLAGRRVAEVPTTWRDRAAGESNFRLRQWLPHYLRWYGLAMRGRFSRSRGPG